MSGSSRVALTDADELLHRQVHPKMRVDGRPSNELFMPRSGDAGLVSVDRSSKASAEDAWRRYVASGKLSAEVWSVSVGDVIETCLSAHEDPLEDNDAHCVVDFNPTFESATDYKAQKKKANRYAVALAAKARSRGQSFVAPQPE